jgi:FixJ family two-component response regulator
VGDVTCSGPHIALIDDEASVRTALGRLLRLADYQVTAFATGEDFLASLATRRPDCAIIDVHMPGLSGLDVQARLCAAHGDIAVVFITASDDPALDARALAAGGATLLRKPFSNDALLATVCAALGSKAAANPP